jgi:hypothetical protein
MHKPHERYANAQLEDALDVLFLQDPCIPAGYDEKSPAENRGAFDLNIVMRIEAFRPWQTWQRPTLPSLEA